MADVDVTVSDNISKSIEDKLTGIAKAARSGATAVKNLQTALNKLQSPAAAFSAATTNATKLGTAINKVNSAVGGLRGNVTQLNQGLAQTATRAGAAGRGLQTMARHAQTAQRSFVGLSSASRQLGGLLLAGFGVAAFFDVANAADNLNNKLLNLATSQTNFYQLQDQMFESANRTRQSVDAFTDAFVRYSKVLIPLGSDQAEVLQITETLSKAFVVAGKTASEASSGVIQLGQALQSGRLSGDEFRSVMENMPIEVIQALADELDVPITQLKKLSTEGKITADVIRNAILSITEEIDTKFNRTIVTLDQSINILRNKFVQFFSENQGPARTLASIILTIGDNLNIVIPIIVTFGAAWLTVQLALIVRDLWLLTAAVIAIASPIVVATAAAVAFVGILALMAEVIARLTGQYEAWQGWLDMVTESIATNIAGLINMTSQAAGINQLQESVRGLGNASDVTAAQVQDSVRVMAGGRDSVHKLGDAYTATTEKATKAGTEIREVAGAVTSISGRYNGVIDVARALDQSAGSAKGLVTQLTTISGRASGVYRVTQEVDKLDAATKKTTNSMKALADTMKKSFQGQVLKGPVNSPSFENIKSPGSNSPSITRLAKGGSFRVGGAPGVDRNLVRFQASRRERVDVLTPAQQRAQAAAMGSGRGTTTVNITVVTPDADSFHQSRRQVADDMQAVLGG